MKTHQLFQRHERAPQKNAIWNSIYVLYCYVFSKENIKINHVFILINPFSPVTANINICVLSGPDGLIDI